MNAIKAVTPEQHNEVALLRARIFLEQGDAAQAREELDKLEGWRPLVKAYYLQRAARRMGRLRVGLGGC